MKTPIVEIYGRRTIECLFDCISKLNSSPDGKVILRAYSNNINTGIKLAQILKKHVGIEIQKTEMDSIFIDDISTSFIKIPVKLKSNGWLNRGSERPESWIKESINQSEFINYSTYQIVFDLLFSKIKKIEILTRDKDEKPIKLLSIFEENGINKYEPIISLDNTSSDKVKILELAKKRAEVINVLYRSGVLMPDDWKNIAKKLSCKDDVILGLDTNILINCSISEHILPMVSLVETREFVNTPNWILLIVPSTVMYELEKNSNSRNNGHLTRFGMQAYRGLQEILELNQNIDISGVSLLIAGENNPILDLQNTIKPISKNLFTLCQQNGLSNIQIPAKSSGEDMMIRSQFRQFLSQINFHKNTFFLTADKTSAALATTEGIESIYIPDPVINDKKAFSADSINDDRTTLFFDPTIGNIIYEMAVSFGSIYVKAGEKIIQLSPDKKGDSLGRWLRKQLRISKEDLGALLKDYDGKINLMKAVELFEKMSKRFENIDWMIEMNNALNNNELQ